MTNPCRKHYLGKPLSKEPCPDCGTKATFIPMTNTREWEEELQNMLREVAEPREWAHKNRGGAVMDFIRTLLSEERSRVLEEVEGLADEVRLHSTGVKPIFAKVVFVKRLNSLLTT